MPVNRATKQLGEVEVEAYDGWDRFAKKHGTNVTALADVIGWYLGTMVDKRLPPWLERITADAAELQHQRRKRGGTR